MKSIDMNDVAPYKGQFIVGTQQNTKVYVKQSCQRITSKNKPVVKDLILTRLFLILNNEDSTANRVMRVNELGSIFLQRDQASPTNSTVIVLKMDQEWERSLGQEPLWRLRIQKPFQQVLEEIVWKIWRIWKMFHGMQEGATLGSSRKGLRANFFWGKKKF